ncbi:MAG: efflux RND transporter periplasmic adaptor subunit [Pseudomonadota bacterium]|nr:efflux RND transporter periplasmic adaptor subunit [Pseudomonadota bacterium]
MSQTTEEEIVLHVKYRVHLRVGAGLLALVLAGCGDTNTYVEPPPPRVTVATPLIQEVTEYLEFTGTTVASDMAEVRARVAGVLLSMEFTPGTRVEEGDLLFVIDPREYEADLQTAEAELASAQADEKLARTELTRAQRLYKSKAGPESDVVKWQGQLGTAHAAILRAGAKIKRAQLNLEYTRVVAPISGRVGREQVDTGNLVGEGEATLLTEVTRQDPMYVYFNVNERDLLRVLTMYREKVKREGIDPDETSDDEAQIPLYLGLANEAGYPHEGLYEYGASSVDPETGTLELRGIFENRDKPPTLLPGLFARIRFPIDTRPDMPLVTERAVAQDQSGTYLLVVNSEDMVERHGVKTGQRIDGLIVIEEGLRKDARVVVEGVQRARPGRTVDPEQVDMKTLTTSARQKAAAAADAARVKRSSPATDAQPSSE